MQGCCKDLSLQLEARASFVSPEASSELSSLSTVVNVTDIQSESSAVEEDFWLTGSDLVSEAPGDLEEARGDDDEYERINLTPLLELAQEYGIDWSPRLIQRDEVGSIVEERDRAARRERRRRLLKRWRDRRWRRRKKTNPTVLLGNRRKCRGYTSRSAKRLRWSCMELTHLALGRGGSARLITLNLPAGRKSELSEREVKRLGAHHSDIVNEICEEVSRQYGGARYIRVTEYSVERSLKAGRVFWHVHILIFIDAKITDREISKYVTKRWTNLVKGYLDRVGNFKAAVRVERVRHLNKMVSYMAKRRTKSSDLKGLEDLPGFFIPPSTWSCSIEVSQAVEANLANLTNAQTEMLVHWAFALAPKERAKYMKWMHYVKHGSGHGIVGFRCFLTDRGIEELHKLKETIEKQSWFMAMVREGVGLSND